MLTKGIAKKLLLKGKKGILNIIIFSITVFILLLFQCVIMEYIIIYVIYMIILCILVWDTVFSVLKLIDKE